jgi:hypothetical protein
VLGGVVDKLQMEDQPIVFGPGDERERGQGRLIAQLPRGLRELPIGFLRIVHDALDRRHGQPRGPPEARVERHARRRLQLEAAHANEVTPLKRPRRDAVDAVRP